MAKVKRVIPTILITTITIIVCVFLSDILIFDELFESDDTSTKAKKSNINDNQNIKTKDSIDTKKSSNMYETITDYFASPKTISLIVFKLPRSGSSWFTEKLNDLPYTYVTKEIVQRGDYINSSSEAIVNPQQQIFEVQNHLHDALLRPLSKYSSKQRFFPDGRYMEDYLFHPEKYLYGLHYIGYTINPEHLTHFEGKLNWTYIVKDALHPVVIVYLRTNIVKAAISAYRGQLTHALCEASNLRGDQITCPIPSQVNWTLSEFIENVNYWQIRYENFIRLIMRDPVIPRLQRRIICYEELQQDDNALEDSILSLSTDPKIRRLAEEVKKKKRGKGYIEWLWDYIEDFMDNMKSYWKYSTQGKGWKKRTTEDLSTLLVEYSRIKSHLKKYKECECILQQLEARYPKVHDLSCLQTRIAIDGCYAVTSNPYTNIIIDEMKET